MITRSWRLAATWVASAASGFGSELSPGQPAPPLTPEKVLQSPDGAECTWQVLTGKVVVLEFWGTWCAPCVAAISHMNELAEEFADENIVFLSVTYEDEATIREFLTKRPMHSWIGLDTDQSMVRDYGIEGWPTTFLVDQDGTIAAITYPTSVTPTVLHNLLQGKDSGLFLADFRKKNTEQVTPNSAVPPLFEISIRPSTGNRASYSTGADHMTVEGQSLQTLLPIAYGVPASRMQITTDLPAERLDVRIQLPHQNDRRLKELLASALEETFQFQASPITEDVQVMIVTAPAPRLTETVAKDGSNHTSTGSNGFQGVGVPLTSLIRYLEKRIGQPFVDETNLQGRYDIALKTKNTDGPPELIQALQEQLGLSVTEDQRNLELLRIEPRTPH